VALHGTARKLQAAAQYGVAIGRRPDGQTSRVGFEIPTMQEQQGGAWRLPIDFPNPVAKNQTRWIARLKPMAGTSINELLRVPLSLDVWERKGEVLVVAAEEEQLAELERRRLAQVERICTIEDYKTKA
jgi:hypothetical protein